MVNDEISWNWKELTLAVLMIASAMANAYLWKRLIFSGNYTSAAFFSMPLAAVILFALFFAFAALFIKSRTLGYISVAAAFIGSFFFITASSAVMVLLSAATLAALWAFFQIRNDVALSVSFSLQKILKHGLPFFFTAFALIISSYYLSFVMEKEGGRIVPRAVFDVTLPALEGPLREFLPVFRPEASVDELLIEALKIQLGQDADVSKIPKDRLEKLLEEQREALGRGLGINVTGKEKAADILYMLANRKIEEFAGPYKRYIPYLSAFGFFLALKMLTAPLYFITLGLTFVVVKIFLMLEVLKREKVTMQAERIIL